TIDGNRGRPCSSGKTTGMPCRTVATSELVVPRSMPTASLRSCGAGEASGSEICSRAIAMSRLHDGDVDVLAELGEKPELAHLAARLLPRAIDVEHALQLARALPRFRAHLAQHSFQRFFVARRRSIGNGLTARERLLEK